VYRHNEVLLSHKEECIISFTGKVEVMLSKTRQIEKANITCSLLWNPDLKIKKEKE
jgi:hypothetical protein